MNKIKDFETLNKAINSNDLLMIYISTPNCSVCHDDLPRAESLTSKLNVLSYQVDFIDVPEVRGQFQVFTAPTIILFFKGKEYHRQARIIDFNELEYRVNQIMDNI